MERSTLRIVAVLVFAKLIALGLYVLVCAVSVMWNGSHDNGRRGDAIVVMGAAQYDGVPSPLLEARLEHALALWRDGRAPIIAVTGGKKSGDRFTEADASRRWLIGKGVPAIDIVLEDRGASTWQSLSSLAPVLRSVGADQLIAVSSSWHVERVMLTLRDLGFSASASAVHTGSHSWVAQATRIHTWRETVGIALGRFIGFGRLFDLTG